MDEIIFVNIFKQMPTTYSTNFLQQIPEQFRFMSQQPVKKKHKHKRHKKDEGEKPRLPEGNVYVLGMGCSPFACSCLSDLNFSCLPDLPSSQLSLSPPLSSTSLVSFSSPPLNFLSLLPPLPSTLTV